MEQVDFAYELETEFGELLMRHLERLAATAVPVVNFPMNTATLACSVLITERENQLKSNELTQRFTRENLLQEISELGVPVNGNLEEIIQMMERAGYVRVQEGQFLVSETPLSELCRLLDEVFPRMPGLNLVAYLVQTMEEVLSGRKGLDEARRQLDQVLEMHGVPIFRSHDTKDAEKAPSSSSMKSKPVQKIEGKKSKRALEKKDRQAMLKLLRAAASQQNKKRSLSKSRVIRSELIVAKKDNVKKDDNPGASCPENEASGDLQVALHFEEQGGDALVGSKEDDLREIGGANREKIEYENAEAVTTDAGESQELPAESLPDIPAAPEKLSATEPTESSYDLWAGQERSADKVLPDVGKQESVVSDEEIEKRIAAFEEELAMACPLCGKGKIVLQETPKGKQFYECSREGCYFISWGKPYHLSCPNCGNSFLIEAVDGKGRIYLKCPRATCNYRQNVPGEEGPFQETEKKRGKNKTASGERPVRKPTRTVVRRRLVRRKK